MARSLGSDTSHLGSEVLKALRSFREEERKEDLFLLSLLAYLAGLLAPLTGKSLAFRPEILCLGRGTSFELFMAVPLACSLFSGLFSIPVAFSFGGLDSRMLSPLLGFLNISLSGTGTGMDMGMGMDIDVFLILRKMAWIVSGCWLGIELRNPMTVRRSYFIALLFIYAFSCLFL